jgi:hypothetical protein
MRPDGFVGHVREADWRRRCGLVPGTVNAASYLWRVGLGSRVGSTRVVLFRHTRPPLSGFARPDSRLGAAGRDVIWFGKYPFGSGFEDGEHWFGWNFRISGLFSDNGYEYGYFVRISNSNTICLISVAVCILLIFGRKKLIIHK